MIRRFLTRVLMVILILCCGYNWWQVRQMQQEIAALRAQVGPNRAAAQDDTESWLGRASLHAGRAREALARADLPTARRELDRSLQAMRAQADGLWRRLRETPRGAE